MFLSHWLRRDARKASERKRPTWSFRPAVCMLEDRITPSFGFSGFGGFTPPTPGPATHLAVFAPGHVKADVPFYVLVEAQDASNLPAFGYTGTVQFSTSDTGTGVSLPANYTFTTGHGGDNGFHLFKVTLVTPSSTPTTITATDTTTATITGTASTTVDPAPVATQLIVHLPQQVTIGVPTNVTVVAEDASGHIVPNYTGTVSLTTPTDPSSTLPLAHTFGPSDGGKFTFQVIFGTPGSQSVVATDTATPPLTGQATTTVNSVGAVTHLGVLTLGFALAGFPTQIEVVALDANNHIVAGYTGTVTFSSSDTASGVSLPANYQFVAGDHGSHIFNVTLVTPGGQTITATDMTTASITGTGKLRVFSGFPWHGFFGGWRD
jgi:hypothetical protein